MFRAGALIIASVLLELVIENYAVVEKVRVRFHRGLNLLTGETGSGKSIVVDALALLLGGRAAAEMVRSGAERARIAGIFEVEAKGLPEGVEPEDGELIIEREILPNGKSRAFAGGRPVTAALLKEVARQLDIPGVQLIGGTGIDDVRSAFAQTNIDHIIMGAGIDLETRLQIIGRSSSPATQQPCT